MVVDAHTHVFPPDMIATRERIATNDSRFRTIYGDSRARMADGEGLRAYMADQEVQAVVVTSFPFKDSGRVEAANDYVLELARYDRRVIPFVAVNTEDRRAALAEATRCVDRGARGVGELAWYDTAFGESERKELEPLLRYLEETETVLMMHVNEQVGHQYPGKMEMSLQQVVLLLQAHPSLRTILAHMGGGLCFYEFMPELKRTFGCVYYDLAAVPLLYSDALYAFAAGFLKDKVLFGSDYPLLTLKRYRAAIDGLDEDVRRRFLWENARRLFGDRVG